MLHEDLPAFFADFSQPCELRGSIRQVIIDDSPAEAFGLSGRERYLVMQAADLVGVAQGEEVLLAGESWRIAEIEPDATGRLAHVRVVRQS